MSKKNKTKTCRGCGDEIPAWMRMCPQCEQDRKRSRAQRQINREAAE